MLASPTFGTMDFSQWASESEWTSDRALLLNTLDEEDLLESIKHDKMEDVAEAAGEPRVPIVVVREAAKRRGVSRRGESVAINRALNSLTLFDSALAELESKHAGLYESIRVDPRESY